MVRPSAALVLLTALAGVGHACPWWGRPCQPGPVVVYPYCPPPVVYYYPPGPPPGPVIVYPPAPPPAPVEPPKAAAPEAPADKELDPEALYEKAVRSCVLLVTPLKDRHVTADGVLIDAEKRLVLTSAAAVGESADTFVQFPVRNKDGSLMTDLKKYIERIPAGQAIRGKVLFRDKDRDLALVRLDKLPPDTPALPLARQSVRVGSPVYWIGHAAPVDSTFATASGVVRGVGVSDLIVGGMDPVRRVKVKMLTITNPIPGGANGGPILDKWGRVVGLAVNDPGLSAVNRAIDVTEIRAFLTEKKVILLAPPPELPPEPPAPAAGDERAADQAFRRAKLFADGDDNRDVYRAKLNDLIRRYPDTAAGREARKVLDGLK